MEASKRNRRGWDQLMAQAGHKSVVSRNARKRTRAGGRKRSNSSKLKSGNRGDALMQSLRLAQALEANNLKQNAAEQDEDIDDDEWDDDEEEASRSSRRGGVRGAKPRKAARGIVKRVARLQSTLLQASEGFDSMQAALADAAAEVSMLICPKLSHPASRIVRIDAPVDGTEDSKGGDAAASPPPGDLLAANGLWRVPVPAKPQATATLLLRSSAPTAHVGPVHICSICGAGAWGRYACPRTGARLCSRGCLTTHNETKLMKFAS